ncbi:hypothetical protein IF2G_06236 [Cordyceps javanica]|nr:hypothetical protein IF2G_06236 [Cordyceps javanica]
MTACSLSRHPAASSCQQPAVSSPLYVAATCQSRKAQPIGLTGTAEYEAILAPLSVVKSLLFFEQGGLNV